MAWVTPPYVIVWSEAPYVIGLNSVLRKNLLTKFLLSQKCWRYETVRYGMDLKISGIKAWISNLPFLNLLVKKLFVNVLKNNLKISF